MARFGEALSAMDDAIEASLSDGYARYEPGRPGGVAVDCVEVMLDENLARNGPDGLVITNTVGITWRKGRLREAERGGVFIMCRRRFIVEQPIAEDGQWVTVACLEEK